MPRKSAEQKAEEAEKKKAAEAVETGPRSKREEFIPYTGKESLQPYEVIQKAKEGALPLIKYGEPSFSVHRGERKTFKVMAYYASPRGVLRKVWAVLKPTSLRPKDVSIMARLRASGIPGAV